MAKVGIVMGSDSDMPVMAKAADMLEKLGIDYEMTIISAHREPDVFFEYAKICRSKGIQGDHCRSRHGGTSSGNVRGDSSRCRSSVFRCIRHRTWADVDSLYSIVQMPSGIPVATVAINGGANAGIFAAKILRNFRSGAFRKSKSIFRWS